MGQHGETPAAKVGGAGAGRARRDDQAAVRVEAPALVGLVRARARAGAALVGADRVLAAGIHADWRVGGRRRR